MLLRTLQSRLQGAEPIAKRWALPLLIAWSIGLYSNTLFSSFVDDDRAQILGNPYIREFHHLREIFTSSVWSFGGGPSNYYRPMMTLGYLICHAIFGFNPSGFHLINILLNAGVVFLLFHITEQVFPSRAVAATATAMFAFHPIHTEPVAWIAAVPDLELTFFYLLAFGFFLKLDQAPECQFRRRHFAMVTAFALALISKEQAVTLPVLATLFEHFYREDRSHTTCREKVSRYGSLWLLTFLYFLLRVHFLGGFAPQSRLQDLIFYQTALSSAALIGQYLGKLLWPVHLAAVYVFHPSVIPVNAHVLLGVLGCLVSLGIFLISWNRARPASFGVAWVFITLSPVLNPHWLGQSVFAERYLYLPSIGFCWLVGAGLTQLHRTFAKKLLNPVPRAVTYAAVGILAALCAIRIVSRNRDWRNEVVFYTRTLADAPDLPPVNEQRLSLEAAYARQGDLQAAEAELRLMLASEPDNIRVLSDLGAVLMGQARLVEASRLLLRAVEIDPVYSNARVNLGDAYFRLGKLEQATAELRAATQLKPAYSASYAYASLGLIYARTGDPVQAEKAYKSALSVNSNNNDAHVRLGALYAEAGRNPEAIREYNAVLKDDPGNAAALVGLSSLPVPP